MGTTNRKNIANGPSHNLQFVHKIFDVNVVINNNLHTFCYNNALLSHIARFDIQKK